MCEKTLLKNIYGEITENLMYGDLGGTYIIWHIKI